MLQMMLSKGMFLGETANPSPLLKILISSGLRIMDERFTTLLSCLLRILGLLSLLIIPWFVGSLAGATAAGGTA